MGRAVPRAAKSVGAPGAVLSFVGVCELPSYEANCVVYVTFSVWFRTDSDIHGEISFPGGISSLINERNQGR